MASQQDFKELLELFNAHRVEYLIVGGYALAFHGVPRFTGDMELFVKPSPDNAARVLVALADFGALDLTVRGPRDGCTAGVLSCTGVQSNDTQGGTMICCRDMDGAVDLAAIVQTPKHAIRDGRIRNDISSEYFLRTGPEDRYDYFALNYCPFCGKAISLGLWAAEKKK